METCFRHHWDNVYELWFLLKGELWMEGGAETSCQWSPVDLTQQRGCVVNDRSKQWVSHQRVGNPWLQHGGCSQNYLQWELVLARCLQWRSQWLMFRLFGLYFLDKNTFVLPGFPPGSHSVVPVLSDVPLSHLSLQKRSGETVSAVVTSSPSLKSYPGRPPPSSVSAPLPLKCVCLIASESLHWPENNFQNYK